MQGWALPSIISRCIHGIFAQVLWFIPHISLRLFASAPVSVSSVSQEQPEAAVNVRIQMDSAAELVGVITKTRVDSCEISANISGTHAVLHVDRKQFYNRGNRCVGDMRNILAVGMEIKFCFSASEPTPLVSIAWLGDKPEVKEDEPETEYQGKGVITQIARNTCGMCAPINGTPESLSFHRRIFFAFGIRCDGSLANILGEGMEVEFCYVVRESKVVVIAVWLGEKPDVNRINDVLEAVYNEKGRVCEILDTERFIVHGDHVPGIVLVDARAVFQHGAPNAVDLAVGDDITFDAIPLECEDETGAKFEATCVWIGQVPSIVDRFSLNSPDDSANLEYDLTYFQENCVEGIVAVIVSELVAFVHVEHDGYIEQVLLFRSSFQRSCERLQDKVSVGDRILVVLGIGSILPGCRRLYAVNAWTDIQEMNACVAEAEAVKIVKPKEFPLPPPNKDVEMDRRPKPSQNPVVGRFNAKSKVLYPHQTGVVRPYSAKKIPKSKQEHLALIRSSNDNVLSLLHAVDFYVEGKVNPQPQTFATLVKSQSTVVHFEGVLNPYPEDKITKMSDEKFSHVATCAWVGPRPSLKTVAARASAKPLTKLPTKNTRLTGYVTKLYLPNKAIATISKQNKIVCLHVNSFASKSGAGLISDYVNLGQRISFQVVPDPECQLPVLAVNVQLG